MPPSTASSALVETVRDNSAPAIATGAQVPRHRRILTKVIAVLGISIFTFGTLAALRAATRSPVLGLSDRLPPVRFVDRQRRAQLLNVRTASTILVLIDTKCDHCRQELNVIEHGLEHFRGRQLYILSTETVAELNASVDAWPRLSKSWNVRWGHIDPREEREKLGRVTRPMTLVFDGEGRLRRRVVGEFGSQALGSL